MSTVESLPRKGVYTLTLFLSRETILKVGALGPRRFPKGYYTYTGSALGAGSSSLRHRVLRHLKTKRRRFWHIDYLLDHKTACLTGVVAAGTDTRVECTINRYIKTKENGQIPVSHFGASDCRKNCGSHLLYFGQENIAPKIATLYNSALGIKPITVDLTKKIRFTIYMPSPSLSTHKATKLAIRLSITVKSATINDLDALHEIEKECFTLEAFPKEQIARLLEHPSTISLGAWMNQEIAGFIIGSITEFEETRVGHVLTLDIVAKHRRRGIGLRLLMELERVFAAKDVEMCYLEVGVDNVAARELYRKQGYTEVEALSDYYHKGEHGVRLAKRLKT